jgi:tRNA-specific 2-thiouridylase
VTLGDEADLYTRSLIAEDFNLISVPELTAPMRVTAKTRYSQTDRPAVVSALGDGRYMVEFDEPQRAVTSGQAVVLYDGDIVVGGGTIV